ncbi:Hypothetical predicted protein [Pelobates cultripes]|uniref:Uncharacterized protein n=1 Tax=Pelobates cultripes TaxID=61616 RepID=A0AAD1VIX3_PELCU|nr:Hypothetical predicted protein [Pelobates cultripes]
MTNSTLLYIKCTVQYWDPSEIRGVESRRVQICGFPFIAKMQGTALQYKAVPHIFAMNEKPTNVHRFLICGKDARYSFTLYKAVPHKSFPQMKT